MESTIPTTVSFNMTASTTVLTTVTLYCVPQTGYLAVQSLKVATGTRSEFIVECSTWERELTEGELLI